MSDPFLLKGEVDAASVLAIERALFTYLEDSDGEALIDCSGLTFVDSTGLTMLVRVKRAAGRRLVLADVPPFVYRLLETTGLGDWFQLRYRDGRSPNGQRT
jgi:anti-anti-sigma factor